MCGQFAAGNGHTSDNRPYRYVELMLVKSKFFQLIIQPQLLQGFKADMFNPYTARPHHLQAVYIDTVVVRSIMFTTYPYNAISRPSYFGLYFLAMANGRTLIPCLNPAQDG
jgi:hypothetical protein